MLHHFPVEATFYAMLHSLPIVVYPFPRRTEVILNALPNPHVRQSLVHLDAFCIRLDDLLVVEQHPLIAIALPNVCDIMTRVNARSVMADKFPQAVLRTQTRVPDLLLLSWSRARGSGRGRTVVVGMREQPFDGALRSATLSTETSTRAYEG